MQVQDAIRTRLSIRRVADTTIPDERYEGAFKAFGSFLTLETIPQNWEFVFVHDPDLKHTLIQGLFNQRFVRDCTDFIAAVADPGLKWHMVDITIALTKLTLQAVELGYGTCWIGAFDENQVKQILKVPHEEKLLSA